MLKYVVFKENLNSMMEIEERKLYIYDTFPGVYRIEKIEYKDRFELECFSILKISLIVIIGHYFYVSQYLSINCSNIECETLIIISCFIYKMKLSKLLNVKKIFVSKSIRGETIRYIGKDYGFNFRITKSELMFYNTRKMKLNERLNKSFDYVKRKKRK